ncbi:MAG: hypothetical protein QNI98_02160 [Woeseiaceae bacterium]|nr:hypothetical protein [Woeseiaceae bacterium]
MNKGTIRIWMLLAVLFAAGGCASNPASYTSGNSILSAADAERMINVTVTPSTTDSLVAALNQEVE